jgi:hypothetical protein
METGTKSGAAPATAGALEGEAPEYPAKRYLACDIRAEHDGAGHTPGNECYK